MLRKKYQKLDVVRREYYAIVMIVEFNDFIKDILYMCLHK
jgi:hypothetical protein